MTLVCFVFFSKMLLQFFYKLTKINQNDLAVLAHSSLLDQYKKKPNIAKKKGEENGAYRIAADRNIADAVGLHDKGFRFFQCGLQAEDDVVPAVVQTPEGRAMKGELRSAKMEFQRMVKLKITGIPDPVSVHMQRSFI